MAKNIIKEIIIILLLTLAIILVLGVLLYEYVPANKIIPEKVSYSTPEKVKDELITQNNIDDTEVIITYQIDSTDLRNYKVTQDYVPGKKNPFSSLTTEENNNSNEGENNIYFNKYSIYILYQKKREGKQYETTKRYYFSSISYHYNYLINFSWYLSSFIKW